MIKRFVIAFVLLVLVAGGLIGFNLFRDRAIEQFFATMKRPAVTVSTTTVSPVTWSPSIGAIGTVSAARGVDLTVETAGIVKEILFSANQQVEQGQILVHLDDDVQQADLTAAQSQAALDEQVLARARELQSKGVGSESSLQTAQAAASVSASQVAKLMAVVEQKKLKAPFKGTVGIPRIDLGQYLAPGTIVATLQDLETMHANFTVPEQQFGLLEIGQPVRLGLNDIDMPFAGAITGIDPKIDPATRLVSVRADITNSHGRLNPGQFVQIRVLLPSEENVITVPQTALVASLYGDYVYVVGPSEDDAEQQIVEQRFVKPGRRADGGVEILEGISAGDVVVNAGQNRLSNGARVTVDNTIQPKLAGDSAK